MTRSSTIWSAWPAFRRWTDRLAALFALSLCGLAVAGQSTQPPGAAEASACRTVRLADIGWTDVTATTAILGEVLKGLGYDPRITLLSVPVTYEVMRQGGIDVFLGNWMPVQRHDRQPYLDDRSVEVVRVNLTGAKFSLAVPAYLYAQGLRDFADIQRFGAALDHTLYGIEAGSVGDRHILDMIAHNDYGLGSFHLVESSEQGMLAEVARAYAARAPIVFLAWDPHPMNMRFDIRYLTGGDASFGPNYGGATVVTLSRAGYLKACPNVARLLRNLQFSTRGESEMMRSMLDEHRSAPSAAAAWVATHPSVVGQWLVGVQTFDGQPAGSNVSTPTTTGLSARFESWLALHKLPVGPLMASGIDSVKHSGAGVFQATGAVVSGAINAVYRGLSALPTWLLILAVGWFAWWMQRSWSLTVFVLGALLLIVNLGYWQQTLETLALVIVSTATAAAVGVPIGIACAHRPALAAALRPVLDLMQTLPTFVYLIPTLVLFGLGVVPALISTVIFALPAPIRLTQLGISGVPRSLIEAGEAFGATRWQMLYKVELPGAAPLILAGITQCIMLSLSMAVIAALVGAGGLGVPVVRALSSVQVGMGIEAGLAIVLLAIILDRIMRHPQPPR